MTTTPKEAAARKEKAIVSWPQIPRTAEVRARREAAGSASFPKKEVRAHTDALKSVTN